MISAAQYRILDLACVERQPVSWLHPDSPDHRYVMKQSHGLSFSELLETLFDLSKQNMLAFYLSDLDNKETRILEPSVNTIRAALTEYSSDGYPKVQHTYALTESGGALWEQYSMPDWDSFILSNFECENTTIDDNIPMDRPSDKWTTRSRSRILIEKYLASEVIQRLLVPGTVVLDSVAPWQATDWKELPMAHRIQYQCKRSTEDIIYAYPPDGWYTKAFASE